MSEFKDVMAIRYRVAEKDGQQGHEIEIEFDPEFRSAGVMKQGPVMVGIGRSINELIDDLSDKAAASMLVAAIVEGAESIDEAIDMAGKRILETKSPKQFIKENDDE